MLIYSGDGLASFLHLVCGQGFKAGSSFGSGKSSGAQPKGSNMPVLAKFKGIVIRMLTDRTFGMHFHAFYGDSELVIGVHPLRVIQGEAPQWVQDRALAWVRHYQFTR